MPRKKKNCGSKWELNRVRRYSRGQTDQGEVLDDYYHMTSVLGILRSEVTLLQEGFNKGNNEGGNF